MVSCALVPIIVTHKSRFLKSIENQQGTKTNEKELLLQPHPPVGQKPSLFFSFFFFFFFFFDREDKLVHQMDEMSPIFFMLSEARNLQQITCRVAAPASFTDRL